MSLQEMCQLAYHYWKIVVGITIGFVIAVVLVLSFVFTPRYQSESTISVSDPSSNVTATNLLSIVNGFAMSESDSFNLESPNAQATVALGPSGKPQSIIITIESSESNICIKEANELAESVVGKTKELLQELEEINKKNQIDLSALNNAEDVAGVLSGSILQDILGSDLSFEYCTLVISEAKYADPVGLGGTSLLLIALIGGLLISLVLISAIYFFRKPIRGEGDVESAAQLPVLNYLDNKNTWDYLWLNIQLVAETPVESICLVPLRLGTSQVCAYELESAIRETENNSTKIDSEKKESHKLCGEGKRHVEIHACEPLSSSVNTVVNAQNSSVTVICIREWSDTLSALKRTVRELKLAKANLIGVALLPQK